MLSTESAAVSGKESTAMNLKMPSLLKIRDIQPPQQTMPPHMTSRQNLLPHVKQTHGGGAPSFSGHHDGRGSKPAVAGGGILVRKNEIPVNRLAPGAYVGPVYGESQDYGKPILVPGKSHHLKHLESQQQQLHLKHAHGMKTTNFGPVVKVSGHSRNFGVQPVAAKVTSSAVGAHHCGDTVLSLRRGTVAHRLPSGASLGLSVGRGVFGSVGLAKDNKMSLLISSTASSSPRTQPAPVRSVPYGLQSPVSSSSVSISSSSHSVDRLVIKSLRPSSVVRSSPFEYDPAAYDASPISLVTSSEHQQQQAALNSSSSDGPMDMSRSSKKLIGSDQPTDMSRSFRPEQNERSGGKFHSTLRLQMHGGGSGGASRSGWQDLDLSSVSDWKDVRKLIIIMNSLILCTFYKLSQFIRHHRHVSSCYINLSMSLMGLII